MFGKITEFAIQANRITILVLVAIPLIGLLVFLNYPRQEDPSIEIRQAIVTASHPGMKVYQVEDLITRTLEEKIREIGEVDDVWSSSQDGRTTIYAEVDDWVTGPEIKRVWQMLRNKMSDAVPELPEGTNGPFVNDEFGLTALATIALWSDGFSLEEMRRVARDARRQLDSLVGVERIELFGMQPERIFLTASNTRLASLGIPPQAIVDTLQAQNVILPGGTINAAGQSVRIEASGTFDDVTDIEDVLVPISGSEKTIALKDIVEVVRGHVDPAQRPVFYNGRPAIVLSVSILDGVNAVEFGHRLKQRVAVVQRKPADRLCAGVRYLSAGAGRARGKRSDQQPRTDARRCHRRRRAVPRDPRRPDRRCLYPADHPALAHRHVNLGGRPAAYVDRGCDHRARHHGRQRHRRCGSNAQPPGSGRRPSAGSSGNSARPGPTAVDLDADDDPRLHAHRARRRLDRRIHVVAGPSGDPGLARLLVHVDVCHADDVLLVPQDIVSCGGG